MEQEAFPKEWVDMKAFFKTVCNFLPVECFMMEMLKHYNEYQY
jgi:hypothetical protein